MIEKNENIQACWYIYDVNIKYGSINLSKYYH